VKRSVAVAGWAKVTTAWINTEKWVGKGVWVTMVTTMAAEAVVWAITIFLEKGSKIIENPRQ
jgi:hypothetical protein